MKKRKKAAALPDEYERPHLNVDVLSPPECYSELVHWHTSLPGVIHFPHGACTLPDATGDEHLGSWELYAKYGKKWQSTGRWQSGICADGIARHHWKFDVPSVRTEWSASVLSADSQPDDHRTDAPAIAGPKKRVGIQSAADYLGMKYDAFEQARKRWMRNHGRIPGEYRVGNQPAWRESDLDEWMASRPRATSPAS